MMSAARPVVVKLDPSIHARMQKLARAQDRSTHYLMREAIAQYVEREERRETFRQDALRAWERYQLAGQHATQAEADSWMAELEAGRDREPPECHE